MTILETKIFIIVKLSRNIILSYVSYNFNIRMNYNLSIYYFGVLGGECILFYPKNIKYDIKKKKNMWMLECGWRSCCLHQELIFYFFFVTKSLVGFYEKVLVIDIIVIKFLMFYPKKKRVF